MATLDELDARLKEVARELEDVRSRLDTEGGARHGLMRDTLRCPACGQREVFQVTEFISGNTLVCTHVRRPRSFTKECFDMRLISEGVLGAFVCGSCGHCEMQLDGVAALEGKANVRKLEAPRDDGGPYR